MASDIDVWWRLRWAGIGAGIAVLLIVATWGIAHLIRTPQDILADAAPPPPSQITYPVTVSVLQPDVVLPGTMSDDQTVSAQLGVDERAKVADLAKVVVILRGSEVEAKVTHVAGNGTYTLRLPEPVKDGKGTFVRVRFVSANHDVRQLTVPISAIFTAPDGSDAVVTVHNGAQHQVRVSLGLTSAGFTGINPVVPGSIRTGDRVLVSQPAS